MSTLLSVAVISLGLLTACLGSEGEKLIDVSKMDCQPEQFLQLDLISRNAVITTCLPQQQVNLFLIWSRSSIPTNFDYAETIAKTGEPLMPALLSVLEKPSDVGDDMNKIRVLIVMEIMSHRRYYEISKNSVYMLRIEYVITRIADEFLKDWAFEIYSKIEHGRKS